MNSELAAALAALNLPTPTRLPTIEETRALLNATIAALKAFEEPRLPPASAYVVKDVTIPASGGGAFSVRTVVPVVEDAGETFPVLVNLHGGGWSIGTADLDDYFLRRLSVELKLSTVNVEYRLAPEHPFPAVLDDALAALKWTVTNASALKVDLSKGFLVGGQSAGGNVSAVVSQLARDDPFFKEHPLTGQLLREPMVIHPDCYPENLKSELRAMEENKDAPLMTREHIDLMIEWYNAPIADPRFSPLLAPSHKGLPRAFIQVMGFDRLRDDGIVYGKVLKEAGVETKVEVHPGLLHGFYYYFPALEVSEKVRVAVKEGVEWLLKRRD
ncbi:Alpha/Beta hydrolase protein [Trametes meyenii]|nr:Alpha/Beta hydrolase protein [Trametes meyenii]